MPIATPEVYAEMLGRAKEHSFAFPAINCVGSETVNAAIKGFADAGSDGIIQFSTGGAEFASGLGVKDMVTGAVALAEFAHIVADKYPITVALHTDHCPKDKLDTYVRPLLAISPERVAGRRTRCSSRICWTARRCRSTRTWKSPRSCSRRPRPPRSSSRSRSAWSAARKTASRHEINDKLYTTPEDFEQTIEALGAASTASTCWPRRSATSTASTSRATSSSARTFSPRARRSPPPSSDCPTGSKPFDFVFHGGSGSLKSEIEDRCATAW